MHSRIVMKATKALAHVLTYQSVMANITNRGKKRKNLIGQLLFGHVDETT